jgi:hypothetical protein
MIKTILFDFGKTLVMDPFCEAIKSCQNEFEKIIKNGKYDLNTEMLIAFSGLLTEDRIKRLAMLHNVKVAQQPAAF